MDKHRDLFEEKPPNPIPAPKTKEQYRKDTLPAIPIGIAVPPPIKDDEVEVVIEGQDADGDGQPDWVIRLKIKDARVKLALKWLAIVAMIVSAVYGMGGW